MAHSALRRSFDVYYRDRARWDRMHALNARFVPQGGLAFDIGAHVGDRTASFRQLGAIVVALEPQPLVQRALRLIHGRDTGVTLIEAAIGAEPGSMEMHINSRNPTLSTLSSELVTTAPSAPAWQKERWDAQVTVPVTILDALIATHGVPDFIKIDVEGFELAALKGLSYPVPSLSFEFTTLQRQVALDCVTRLSHLGDYRFNISLGEAHRLDLSSWVTAADIGAHLAALPDAANSGDVFARRV